MQPEDAKLREDSTAPNGIKGAFWAGRGTPQVHFWSDVTVPASDYVEKMCNGEKWSPVSRDYAFPKGCGAKGRILKEVYPRNPALRPSGPASPAWKIIGSWKP